MLWSVDLYSWGPIYKISYDQLTIRFILVRYYPKTMLRHIYDNCKINHTISQVENLVQTCNPSHDELRTNLKIFCKPGSCFIGELIIIWLCDC